MPNCKSFLVTEVERNIRRRARFQQHRDASCHQVFFFLQGKVPKEIHAILKEPLGEHAPPCTTFKNWVAQFKRGDFSTYDAPRHGQTKTVTTPDIIDLIHELILEANRISAKSRAEQLGISREWVGFIIHEDLDMRKLSAKWVLKCMNSDQIVNGASRLSNFGMFSARSKLVTMDETWLLHYDSEKKRQ